MTLNLPPVLHISTEKGWRGGERQVQLLTEGMLRRGWPCLVASPPDSALFAERAARKVAVPLRARSEFDPYAVAQIIRLARTHRVGLLHAHTSHAHTLAWLAGAFLSVPIVVTRRVDFPVGQNWFSRRKYLSPRLTHIAISQGVRDVLLRAGLPSDRIHVVYSGIDLARYCFRGGQRDEAAASQLGIAPNEILLLNVAALVDHKDHATLIQAAAILRSILPQPWKLLIAGSGELESQIRALIAQHQLEDRVRLLGYIEDLEPLYRAADLFVLSSHLEGLCTSILDAMTAGVPVVATATGGVPEVVEHDVTGLLAPARNPQALAEAIAILAQDPARRSMFALAARKRVEKSFTADAMVEGTLAVYRKVLSL